MMSDRLSVTFADHNSKELPLQSALCAFDCAQILAEWVSTIQQRLGRFVGIFGKDVLEFTQGPVGMFLEEEDIKLLEKVKEILGNAENKLNARVRAGSAGQITDPNHLEVEQSGYGSQLLSVHARMFEREAVWPSKFTCNFVLVPD